MSIVQRLEARPFKILEVWCYGGLSVWETLWLTKTAEDQENYRGFEAGISTMRFRNDRNGSIPPPTPREFENGVYWGPSLAPFLDTLLGLRARMVACRGMARPPVPTFDPTCLHQFTSVSAFTGKPARHRHGEEFGPDAENGAVPVGVPIQAGMNGPYSYIYYPKIETSCTVGQGPEFAQRFFWDKTYGQCFEQQGDFPRPCKAEEISTDPQDYRNIIPPWIDFGSLTKKTTRFFHGGSQVEQRTDYTALGFYSATHKLFMGSRYACVFDKGLQQNFVGWSGYDTHPVRADCPDIEGASVRGHLEVTLNNTYSLFDTLLSFMMNGKIDLDETLVIVNTEMSRHPERGKESVCGCQSGQPPAGPGDYAHPDGRNHWIDRHIVTLIGGPVRSRGMWGAIGGVGNPTQNPFYPHEIYAATLVAAGIDPFPGPGRPRIFDFDSLNADSWGTTWGATKDATRENLATRVLGLTANK